MKIENVKISDLKPYERNARIHPQSQVDLLVQNIKKFGFTTPILIDEKNEIIAGHGRLLALQQMKTVEAPCVRIEGLSEQEVKALRLADNKIASMGEWDDDLVWDELENLKDYEIEIDGDLISLTDLIGIETEMKNIKENFKNSEIDLDTSNGFEYKVLFYDNEEYLDFIQKVNDIKAEQGIPETKDLFIKLINGL